MLAAVLTSVEKVENLATLGIRGPLRGWHSVLFPKDEYTARFIIV